MSIMVEYDLPKWCEGCKDCKHWDGVDTCDVIDAPVWDNDFCSMAAIDAANRADYRGLLVEDVKKVTDEVVKELKQLPPVQPEIIRCKDCKWYELPSHKIYENCVRWMKRNGILLPIKPDDFCSRAERREDEQ